MRKTAPELSSRIIVTQMALGNRMQVLLIRKEKNLRKGSLKLLFILLQLRMMKDVCCYLRCVTIQKMLLGSSKCWLVLEDQNSPYKVVQDQGREETQWKVCCSGKGNTFVCFAHNIQRAKCHPEFSAEGPSPPIRSYGQHH